MTNSHGPVSGTTPPVCWPIRPGNRWTWSTPTTVPYRKAKASETCTHRSSAVGSWAVHGCSRMPHGCEAAVPVPVVNRSLSS